MAYAAPATAAAAVVVVAVLVVPSVLPTATEVELEPADPGPEPVEEPDDVEEPGDPEEPEEAEEADERDEVVEPGEDDPLAPLDAVDGLRDRLPGPEDGQLGECDAELQLSGATDPDAGLDSHVAVTVEPADCPGTPAMSPSGQRVAWIEDGGRLLAVDIAAALAGDGEADTASWDLEAEGGVDLRGWLSTPDGWELVVAESTEGADQLHRVDIERQDDGELALPADGDVLDDDTAVPRDRLSPVALGPIEPREPQRGAVDLLGLDEANQAFLRRGDLGDGMDFTLGEGVGHALFDDEALEPVATAWITSTGLDVLLGDGEGSVWHIRLPEAIDDSPEATELDADWDRCRAAARARRRRVRTAATGSPARVVKSGRAGESRRCAE